MGHEYVAAVISSHLPGLSYNAFRVLARMALVVRDSNGDTGESEGVYYGGWKPLGYVFSGHVYESHNDPLPPAVEQKIRRAIAELRDAGYLVTAPPDVQRGHVNRVYRINLNGHGRPTVDN